MKLICYILLILLIPAIPVGAQTLSGGQVQVSNQSILISDNGQVMIGMDITLPAAMELSSNCVATLTPVLKTQDNSYNRILPAIWVYGRIRSIVQQRERSIPSDAYTILRRKNGTEQTVNYSARIPYEKWMNGAELELQAAIRGCADCQKEENSAFITRANLERYVVKPVVAFVSPAVEAVKNRAEEGRAYLDFPVNQMKIYPDYRRNPSELAAIKHTVDVVKNDVNTTITEIAIVGYASPEGRYAANARLAQGRAEALKSYVMNEYGFKADLFKVNSVPEDWAGLRAYVAKNDLPLKEEILSIIDKNESDFDVKEERIKALDGGKVYAALLQDCYPALRHSDYTVRYVVRGFDVEEAKNDLPLKEEILSIIDKNESDFDVKEERIKALDGGKVYAALLQDCYPALRHSDYTVRYVVRGFDVEEAKQIIKLRPQQLSLQEMFLVAQTYEKGSDEFNEVFDVAVRMFPDDPTANINAAAIELQRGDLQQAVRYLDKADAQASATLNNRGVLKLLQGDLDSAENYFKQAQAKDSVEAGANLEEVTNKRKDEAIFVK